MLRFLFICVFTVSVFQSARAQIATIDIAAVQQMITQYREALTQTGLMNDQLAAELEQLVAMASNTQAIYDQIEAIGVGSANLNLTEFFISQANDIVTSHFDLGGVGLDNPTSTSPVDLANQLRDNIGLVPDGSVDEVATVLAQRIALAENTALNAIATASATQNAISEGGQRLETIAARALATTTLRGDVLVNTQAILALADEQQRTNQLLAQILGVLASDSAYVQAQETVNLGSDYGLADLYTSMTSTPNVLSGKSLGE